MTIIVLGATGFTGRLIVAELCRRQHHPVLAGRDLMSLASVADEHGLGMDNLVEIDVTSPNFASSLRHADIIINTVGPFVRLGPAVVDAALAVGADLVDISGEQAHLVRLADDDARAKAAGITLVPAAGFDFAPGELLAGVCAATQPRVTDIDICYAVATERPSIRLQRRAPMSSHGTRTSVAAMLSQEHKAFVDGKLVYESIGQARRLAWFPRPVGPRHAAGIPGGEAVLVPRRMPSVTNVRTYLAMPTWRAELLQAVGTLARGERFGNWLHARLTSNANDPTPQVRECTKWAAVCEARFQREVVRSWAWGTDPYGFTASAAVAATERLIELRNSRQTMPGVRSIAELAEPQAMLDRLAVRSDLRWGSATATLPG